jgi:hypothetical protein
MPGIFIRRDSTQAGQLRRLTIAAHVRAACVLAVALASPLHGARAQTVAAATAPALQDLRGIDELRSLFDRDQGKIRIVLLLSPT